MDNYGQPDHLKSTKVDESFAPSMSSMQIMWKERHSRSRTPRVPAERPGKSKAVVPENRPRSFKTEDTGDASELSIKYRLRRAEPQPRRNPPRKARNSRYPNYDNIYEKDFRILDSESMSPDNDELTTSKEKSTIQQLKKWPVDGLHERPEYNSVENRIEKFDYTIRDIQNSFKKTTEKVKKQKPVLKKYVSKRKESKQKCIDEVQKKVSIEECKAIVNENYNLLSTFMSNVNAQKEMGLHECHNVILDKENNENFTANHNNVCVKNYENLLVNQSRLYSLMNRVPFKEALDNLKNSIN